MTPQLWRLQKYHISIYYYMVIFVLTLSMCPVNMYFPEGHRPKGKYMFTGHIREVQYKNNRVIMYLLYDIIII